MFNLNTVSFTHFTPLFFSVLQQEFVWWLMISGFQSHQDKDFCIVSVPHLTPEFVLIQSFVKVVPFNNCTLEQDLYVFHRAGLLK